MSEKAVVALGLPSSGKTTYLAALWHLVRAKQIESKLSFVRLRAGNGDHLDAITRRWLAAKEQERTQHSGNKTAVIALKTAGGTPFDLAFPDIAGEAFRQIWEARDCPPDVIDALKAQSVLLFIHASNIVRPTWVGDDAKIAVVQKTEAASGEAEPWAASKAPTQTQLVDILRCLQEAPLNVGPRRLAVILSAWDTAEKEKKSPERYLEFHLPLLHQYLHHGLKPGWEVQFYGVSAQGAEYDSEKKPATKGAQKMRGIDVASKRIKVVSGDTTSHDLTEPLFWLLG